MQLSRPPSGDKGFWYHGLAMCPPMQEMSFWQLVKNSPEWVGVFANALFAIVTIGVVIWQVRVMKWQGRNSQRHERIQNKLIRLQHEHECLLLLNAEREKILKLANKLHLAATSLKETESKGDPLIWEELRNTVHELHDRLRILDVAAYSGLHDQWHPNLEDYVDAVRNAVLEDGKFNSTHSLTDQTPNLFTRKALKDVDDRCEPISIFLDLETAIRMEFSEFKEKWDAELPS
jgi:cell division protein FtsL